jgi:hypothetical protein
MTENASFAFLYIRKKNGKIKYTFSIEKYECFSSIKNCNVECNRIKEGGRKGATHEACEYGVKKWRSVEGTGSKDM